MTRLQWLLIGLLAAFGLAGGGYYLATNRMSGPRWNRLLPQAKNAAQLLLQKAQDNGLQVMFFDGWRDPAESAANIAKGVSFITDPFNSMHVWGAAFDIVFADALGLPSWPDPTDPRWQKLGAIGESLNLKWGGRFAPPGSKQFDGPHFQLPGYSTAALKQEYGNNYLTFLQTSGIVIA